MEEENKILEDIEVEEIFALTEGEESLEGVTLAFDFSESLSGSSGVGGGMAESSEKGMRALLTEWGGTIGEIELFLGDVSTLGREEGGLRPTVFPDPA
jgi:hypothetical protein